MKNETTCTCTQGQVCNVCDPIHPATQPLVLNWIVDVTAGGRVYLEQDGFDDHDIRLYVNGNFRDVRQCFEYAERIAAHLNHHGGGVEAVQKLQEMKNEE